MDNDGWLDLFIASGHVYPQVDSIPGGTPYRDPLTLFRNHRDGTFDDVSSTLADLPAKCRRGVAFGDINNDGNVDMVILNVGEPPTLLINHNDSPNHRVLFKLIGTKSNKSAIGARVSDPGPSPSAAGTADIIVATDVIKMGRSRTGPACSIAARASSFKASRCCVA